MSDPRSSAQAPRFSLPARACRLGSSIASAGVRGGVSHGKQENGNYSPGPGVWDGSEGRRIGRHDPPMTGRPITSAPWTVRLSSTRARKTTPDRIRSCRAGRGAADLFPYFISRVKTVPWRPSLKTFRSAPSASAAVLQKARPEAAVHPKSGAAECRGIACFEQERLDRGRDAGAVVGDAQQHRPGLPAFDLDSNVGPLRRVPQCVPEQIVKDPAHAASRLFSPLLTRGPRCRARGHPVPPRAETRPPLRARSPQH